MLEPTTTVVLELAMTDVFGCINGKSFISDDRSIISTNGGPDLPWGAEARAIGVDDLAQPNNRLPDGGQNPATLHRGTNVRARTKFVITKWYRQFEA